MYKNYSYLVRIGNRIVGDLGGMVSRGSRTGAKCPGDKKQTILFHQVNLAYQPLSRAA